MVSAALLAQVPDAPLGPPGQIAPAPTTPTQPGATPGGNAGTFLGKDIPKFDPKSELLTWDGKSWNINNNRVFQARFEKYLTAPEDTGVDARNYQQIISQILYLLSPANSTNANVDAAFKLLPRGSSYDIDARLCDSIADAVYSAWKSQRAQARLVTANASLDAERRQEYWNATHTYNGDTIKHPSSKAGKNAPADGGSPAASSESFNNSIKQAEHTKRILEIETLIKGNSIKRELNDLQTKIEFQALAVQFFLQRRFQHVLIMTRFYRTIFSDGDTKLNVAKDTKDLFEKTTGMPPTVGTLDSMANEAIRDVREGVKSYEYLVERLELESGSKRLAEALVMGEYVPEIRTLPREKKRLALEFTQKANQLLGAMEAKDYTTGEKLIEGLSKTAKDFDGTQATALIESSRRGAKMHLLAARNAAQTNDQKTFKTELDAAAALWPLNPALSEFSDKIFDQGDVQAKAANEFDTLFARKDFRQIFDNKERFIAALALSPDKQPKLKEVMEHMEAIKGAVLRAEEMRRQNNGAGAWETVERVIANFPEDTKLNQLRGELATDASDFVRTVRTAQDLEKKEQIGSSLAWFLKAQKIYPASDFASEGIGRLKKRILPDG